MVLEKSYRMSCLGGLAIAGKKITAGHRPKTDQKAGMAVYLLNSPDIKPTRAREIELYLALFFCVCKIMSMRNYVTVTLTVGGARASH